MTKDDGRPAFPMTSEGYSNPRYSQYGMSLRDWFAGRVAGALCTATDRCGEWTAPVGEAGAAIIAERAYAVADAMLAARAKGGAA